MNTITNRRTAVQIGAASIAAVVMQTNGAVAQDATPDHGDHATGPGRAAAELTVTLSDTELVFPAEIAAGINHVTFVNDSAGDAHVLTFRLPDDVDLDDLLAVLADEEAPMPDYLRDQYFPGIPDYPPVGGSLTGYVRYEVGTYIALNNFGGQIPAFFDVVGRPWGVPAPLTTHEIGMVEISFLGLDEPVAAGDQVLSIVNNGWTWHEILLIGMPELISPDELLEFFLTTEGPADLEAAGYFVVGASGIISPGTQVWLEVGLEPGAYGALCFAPDDFSGPPHALAGMISTFEVV